MKIVSKEFPNYLDKKITLEFTVQRAYDVEQLACHIHHHLLWEPGSVLDSIEDWELRLAEYLKPHLYDTSTLLTYLGHVLPETEPTLFVKLQNGGYEIKTEQVFLIASESLTVDRSIFDLQYNYLVSVIKPLIEPHSFEARIDSLEQVLTNIAYPMNTQAFKLDGYTKEVNTISGYALDQLRLLKVLK
jgi:hypothetical protein